MHVVFLASLSARRDSLGFDPHVSGGVHAASLALMVLHLWRPTSSREYRDVDQCVEICILQHLLLRVLAGSSQTVLCRSSYIALRDGRTWVLNDIQKLTHNS